MRILLTGSTGFIGINLKQLLSNQADISLGLFSGDISSKEDVENFYKLNGDFEVLIHLAGIMGNDFNALMQTNVIGFNNILDIGIKQGLKKVIFSSSVAVYKANINKPLVESDLKIPNTIYGLSKIYGENLLDYYAETKGVEVIKLRFPNVYGFGNTKGIFYSFLNSIHNSKKIIIDGDGTQVRNYLHVSDASNAIVHLLNFNGNAVFNVTPEKFYSVNDIVSLFKEKYDFDVEMKANPNAVGSIILSGNKLSIETGFVPAKQELDLTGII